MTFHDAQGICFVCGDVHHRSVDKEMSPRFCGKVETMEITGFKVAQWYKQSVVINIAGEIPEDSTHLR